MPFFAFHFTVPVSAGGCGVVQLAVYGALTAFNVEPVKSAVAGPVSPVHGLNVRLNFATTFACGAAVSFGLNDTLPLWTGQIAPADCRNRWRTRRRSRRNRNQEPARDQHHENNAAQT